MGLVKLNNRSSEDTAIHGRRNLIINGAMQVAQRGTSQTTSGYGSIDRFALYNYGEASSVSMSQQTINNEKYAEVTLNKGTATSGPRYALFLQKIEGTVICGKTVTVSFDAWGSSADVCSMDLEYYSGSSYSYTPRRSLSYTDTRTRYTFTFDTPVFNGDSPNSYVALRWIKDADPTSGSSQSINLKITNVQLEVGDKATPFEHRSYGEELALCQRYYETSEIIVSTVSAPNGPSYTNNTYVYGYHHFAVTKRTAPSMSESSVSVSPVPWTNAGVSAQGKNGFTSAITNTTGTNSYGDKGGIWYAEAELL